MTPGFVSKSNELWKYETEGSVISNDGGCRDYCAHERTALSYLRLALLLALLSFALIEKVRFPNPNQNRHNQTNPLEKHIALPLGVIFAAAALVCLGSGMHVYWKGIRGLRDGKGFVGAGRVNTAILLLLALAITVGTIVFTVAS
ncbi:Domain of unknown function DUF202 [Phaffia rhodozyma]|uniref:DUF202 domain-containing protein n=1 Tax=Phaffia rhodozyma TaxID=264483 RepID=A0A0F7SPN9_PHARH|nr:Domain of unknown function DUF202 [Phaffia rhodozyma]